MKTTPATAKSSKTVNIICRIEIKKNMQGEEVHGHVVYQVHSSNGKDIYLTTIIDGCATGCTCPSRKPCYHMTQLKTLEESRVVAAYNGLEAEGANAQHASEKVQRYAKAADLGLSTVVYLRSLRTPECPQDAINGPTNADVCPVDASIVPLEDEEYSEETGKRWTEEELRTPLTWEQYCVVFDPCCVGA